MKARLLDVGIVGSISGHSAGHKSTFVADVESSSKQLEDELRARRYKLRTCFRAAL